MKLYKDYTKKPYSFLVNDTTLPSDNSLKFKKAYYKMTVAKKSKKLIIKLSKTTLNTI